MAISAVDFRADMGTATSFPSKQAKAHSPNWTSPVGRMVLAFAPGRNILG